MNKVWIELEVGTDAENTERAELLNAMLAKCHHNDTDRKLQQILTWWKPDQRYHLKLGPSGTFESLENNGAWFNLDYFAATPTT